MTTTLHSYMKIPLIAILRGIKPDEVLDVAQELVKSGFTMIEVPLGSPDALTSIRLLSETYADSILIGAGTVTSQQQVQQVADAGGKLIVSPNNNPQVIKLTKTLNMVSIPGAATPTEVLSAIESGADAIKAFPAEMLPPSAIKSWRVVMPENFPIFAVGGMNTNNILKYINAGVNGFGLGSNLYKKGKSLSKISADANELVQQSVRFFETAKTCNAQVKL
jgi:2-dehydro-3-deoxyphosphogalactonate aldolase